MRYPAFWQRRGLRSCLLRPLAFITCLIAKRRRAAAARSNGRAELPCPVIVVGNLTVGGTGKTPVLIALARALTASGRTVGVISRGYGAKIGIEPREVSEANGPDLAGDEPWLIHQALNVPVFVQPDRLQAADQLCAHYPEVDVILSDDGLQHHRLPRSVELVVVDGVRRFGNQLCLPAGPLREPIHTLAAVDFVLVNGVAFAEGQWSVDFKLTHVIDLYDQSTQTLDEFIREYAHQTVIALAGIGHPEKFFHSLQTRGLSLKTYALDDHQPVPPALLNTLKRVDSVVVMTEKDAVKWQSNHPSWPVRTKQVFAVAGQIELPDELVRAILGKLPPTRDQLEETQ